MKQLAYTAALVALLLAAAEVRRVADDSHVNLFAFFNGDTLYPAAFYQDVVEDGYSWRGWRFSAATDFFPDFGIYFAARAVTGRTAPAMVVCSCILFILLIGAFCLLMRTVTEREERPLQLLTLLGAGTLFLTANASTGLESPYLRLPIVLTYHGGSLICGVLDLAIVCCLLRANAWGRWHLAALAGLSVNTALCMASDRLLLIQFVAPICAALLVGLLMREVTLRRAAAIGGTLVAASLFGQTLLRLIQPASYDQINRYPFEIEHFFISCRLLAECWHERLVAGDVLHWLATVWFFLCLAYVGSRVVGRVRGRVARPCERGLLLLAIHYPVATAACVVGVGVSGVIYSPPTQTTCDWTGACRYFLPTLFLPLFTIGFATLALKSVSRDAESSERSAGLRSPESQSALPSHSPALRSEDSASRLTRWGPGAAVALLTWLAAAVCYVQSRGIERSADRPVWDYRPDYVAKFDDVAAEFDLRYGFAGFWEAKNLSLLSKRGARVHPIHQNPISTVRFIPFHWLSNWEWYFATPHGGPPPRYEFVVVKEFLPNPTPDRVELRQVFGEPAAIRQCGPYRVLVYNRPEDEKFARSPDGECHFLRETWKGRPGERITFPARSLPTGILGAVPPLDRVAVDGDTPAGTLASGPFLHLHEEGEYRVTLVTTCDSPSAGRWTVHLVNPKNGWLHPVAEGATPVGERVETTVLATVQKRHRGRALECRVDYTGSGTLEVHEVRVERVK